MKNIWKKNQIMITALALMIAIAGYLNFAGNSVDEKEYVPVASDQVTNEALNEVETEHIVSNELEEDYTLEGVLDISEEDLAAAELIEMESLDEPETEFAEANVEEEIPGEAVFTSTTGVTVLSEAKLLKEQTRAKNKETLLEIINSTSIGDDSKQDAVQSMIELTDIAEKETAAEILLEAKGFSDVVVSISNAGVDVVVNATELSDAQRAQIEDIVKRKTGAAGEDIIISTVVQ